MELKEKEVKRAHRPTLSTGKSHMTFLLYWEYVATIGSGNGLVNLNYS